MAFRSLCLEAGAQDLGPKSRCVEDRRAMGRDD